MKPPCTRGLQQFKNGCPERPYNPNDGTGCPLWVEKETPTLENPQVKRTNKMCVDRWYWTFLWSILGALEGCQMATETFRNGMLVPDPDDPLNASKAWPKPDKGILRLIELIEKEQQNRQIIIEHETKKLLEQHEIETNSKVIDINAKKRGEEDEKT